MAGADKIYGTQKQYDELEVWLKENAPKEMNFRLYPKEDYPEEGRPISNFSERQDKWLLKNCPLPFVVNRLKEQYGIKDKGGNKPRTHRRSSGNRR